MARSSIRVTASMMFSGVTWVMYHSKDFCTKQRALETEKAEYCIRSIVQSIPPSELRRAEGYAYCGRTSKLEVIGKRGDRTRKQQTSRDSFAQWLSVFPFRRSNAANAFFSPLLAISCSLIAWLT